MHKRNQRCHIYQNPTDGKGLTITSSSYIPVVGGAVNLTGLPIAIAGGQTIRNNSRYIHKGKKLTFRQDLSKARKRDVGIGDVEGIIQNLVRTILVMF